MIYVNPKYVRGRPMLRVEQLREEDQYCVELHNYYIKNYKASDDIMIQYKEQQQTHHKKGKESSEYLYPQMISRTQILLEIETLL
jgi:hypothetical protein